MKIIFIITGILALFLLYHFLQIRLKIKISQEIVKNTTPFERLTDDKKNSLLVLGDSTAVGVGASLPSDSTPALFSNLIEATSVENQAVSGAKINDVLTQIEKVKQINYTHILLQIGGNNVVARQGIESAEEDLRLLLSKLPEHQVLTVLMCGDVGTATLLPWFVRPYYTKKNLEYHALFARVVPEFGGMYINLSTPKVNDPFRNEPDIYFAKDQFHPSSAGYKLWFDELVLQKKNPSDYDQKG